jgi:cytochrome b561
MSSISGTQTVTAARYSPLIVTLHWAVALLIFLEALVGVGFLHFLPNTAAKLTPLSLHVILGAAMLVLTVARLLAKVLTPSPPRATAGSALLDRLADVTHFLLYVFTLLVALTGALLAIRSHVLQVVIGGAVRLPMQFAPFQHAFVFAAFGALVALHVIASLYHQFLRKDHLFRRMWYARRRDVSRLEQRG